MKKRMFIAMTVSGVLCLASCSPKFSYSPTSHYSGLDARQVTDDDIKNAFDEDKPGIKLPVKIAWYNLGQDDLMDRLLIRNSSVSSENFIIPKTLVEGYRNQSGPYSDAYQVDLKALRLLAAQEKCDVLVMVSSTFFERSDLNMLGCLNILILPAFFLPYNNISAVYNSEVFIFNVRTGYMYAHLRYSPDAYEKRYVMAADEPKLVREINDRFINEAAADLRVQINRSLKD